MLTLSLRTTTDLAPMLEAFSRQARLVAGGPPPDEAELADVKAHAEQALDAAQREELRALKAQLEAALPTGVRLKALSARREGLTLHSDTTLEFDDVSLVPRVTFPGDPALRPFADFTVRREAGRVVLAGRSPSLPPGSGAVTLSLSSSPPPVSHNGTETADGAISWTGAGAEVHVAFL